MSSQRGSSVRNRVSAGDDPALPRMLMGLPYDTSTARLLGPAVTDIPLTGTPVAMTQHEAIWLE